MKNEEKYYYSEIASFEDFRLERERLVLKRKLIEAKLQMSYIRVTEALSFSNIVLNAAKKFILPVVGDFLEGIRRKVVEGE